MPGTRFSVDGEAAYLWFHRLVGEDISRLGIGYGAVVMYGNRVRYG